MKYLLWGSTLAGYLFVLYSTTPYLYGHVYEAHWSAVLFPLNRVVWALMLSTLIYLCITNNAGPVGQLLAWKGFIPLSRLTYSVYLTHVWVVYVTLGARRQLIDPNTRYAVILCCGTVLVSFAVGTLFTILFESPLIHWMNSFKRRNHETSGTSKKETLQCYVQVQKD